MKNSPIFMSLSCSYVCMHTPEKILLSKKLSPWIYVQLKTLFLIISCCGRGFMVTKIGEQLPWLPYCKSRVVWIAREMCCSWPQEWWAPITSRSYQEKMSISSKGPVTSGSQLIIQNSVWPAETHLSVWLTKAAIPLSVSP